MTDFIASAEPNHPSWRVVGDDSFQKEGIVHDQENAFGRSCMRLRTSMGLTQRALGKLLGISEQAIGQWERGMRAPKAEHLERLLALCLKRHAFAPGDEHEQALQLWLAAGQPQADFEALWMQAQLASAADRSASPALLVLKREAAPSAEPRARQSQPLSWPRFDWGDALTVSALYGREAERSLLEQWVLEEHCQVVSVLGLGGVGKSALSVTFMHQVASAFEAVVFRSVRDAPPCQDLLADCLHVLSPEVLPGLPADIEQRLDLLLQCLQRRRCLLVLDNLETLLEAHDPEGHFRAGYEDYAVLLERVAHTPHKSCLLLTSRELPAELEQPQSRRAGVRALRLSGLEPAACEQLLAKREVIGSTQDYVRLAQMYDGNPLALNIVAESICDLFGCRIRSFLEQDVAIFSSIRDLLAEQFTRLSDIEQGLLFWLAVVREPVTVGKLHALLMPAVDRMQVDEALQALQRRSLLERGMAETRDGEPGRYTLHSVVLEYVTELLVEQVSEQILHFISPEPKARHLIPLGNDAGASTAAQSAEREGLRRESGVGEMAFKAEHGGWEHVVNYALEQATAKVYVRQAQEQLLVAPVLLRLQASSLQTEAVEEQLLRGLRELRKWDPQEQGYGPANCISLLRALRGNLRHLDFSHLSIREGYFQGIEMQDATLAEATLRDVVLTEVFNAIWSVAVSPRGTFWAAGDSRGEVRVWRVGHEGGQTLHRTWQAHADTVERALAFSPDERLLATGSWEGAVKLWDVESGTLLWTGWQTGLIENLAFAPDGQRIASCGDDETIRIWDTTSGANVQTIAAQNTVYAVTWSFDSTHLASGYADGRIQIWKLPGTQTATCVQTLRGHTFWAYGVAFAPNGDQLASCGWDRTVRLWDVASGRCLHTLEGGADRVMMVAWSPDGHTVASAGFDGVIRLWDAKLGSYRVGLQGHTAPVYSLAFTPDSGRLLSGSEDRTLRVWDVESGQCVSIIQGYAGAIYDVAWSPDGQRLASVGTDMLVTLWDVVAETLRGALHGHHWVVDGIGWSPDGQVLASAGRDNAIRLWNPVTGVCTHILRDPDYSQTGFYSVAWSPDGHLLAAGSYGYGVQVWEMTTRSRCWVGRAHPSFVRSLAWSPDGTRLASCGDDGTICLWQASDGTLLQTLQEHSATVTTVAWSPDGTWLASGGGGRRSGELFLWHTGNGKHVRSLEGQPHAVSAVVWNTLADQLVSGDSNGTLRWWQAQSGQCLRMQKAHQGAVHALKISPDGKYLASCGEDGTLKVWTMQSSELVRTLQRDRPYERLNITRTQGLTAAQKSTLFALGAFEEELRQ